MRARDSRAGAIFGASAGGGGVFVCVRGERVYDAGF